MSVRSRVRASAVVGVVFSLVFVMQASAASPPTKVIGGKSDQIIPAAGGSFIAWTENRPGTHTYDAWVRNFPISTDTPVRLNPAGTRGYMGGINQNSDEAIYEKATKSGDDLVIVPDLNSPATQMPAPSRINSVRQEAFPTISDNFILFTRASNRFLSILLWDRGLHTMTLLARAPARCLCLISGTVSDRYATWTKCSAVAHCNAHYYDTMGATRGVFPNAAARPVYGGTISDVGGTMYAVRSGASCGSRVRIMRWQVGSLVAPAVVARFDPGTDLVSRLFVYNDGMHDNIYYDPASCATALGNIYEVMSAEI
jgi:hypothetical protein